MQELLICWVFGYSARLLTIRDNKGVIVHEVLKNGIIVQEVQ